jgi:hypothetical protein
MGGGELLFARTLLSNLVPMGPDGIDPRRCDHGSDRRG